MTNSQIIGVLGAGQMGFGIAQVCAQSGYKVFLYDPLAAPLERAQNKAAELGLISIKTTSSLDDFKEVTLVIEAVPEIMSLKVDLFKALENIVSTKTLMTSNTSSLSLTQLASTISNPQRVIGIHFMNPVPKMELVEIIKALQTSKETFEATLEFVKSLGKTPAVCKDHPGFMVNRLLLPLINEAVFMLQEGLSSKEEIDLALKLGANHPMGPLKLADLIGLDTCVHILKILHQELGEDKYRPCPLLIKYVEAGWFGRKTNKGFYSYDKTK
ncbi:MAG TPA: 3-hydroxyacyl-CoA dehydrogenase NAD-binding domain-containing protein [Alphaproteobacteria bacterium]|nr:3-hydroxyacyl-CoA dehydrogenase NAD-binding domain-containing protein [Alphaproteobacteria bacterium]